MTITVPVHYMARGAPCLAYDSTPGRECVIKVKRFRYRTCKSIVAKVLVDCCDKFKVKVLDPDSSLLVLDSRDELDEVAPVLDELRARNIIVVKPIECINVRVIREELRRSFYDTNGELINQKFTNTSLDPLIMAYAWLGFSGSASDDSVRCYHDAGHVFNNWRRRDDPVKKHYRRYRCQCFEQPAYNLPALVDGAARDITGQIYQVVDRTDTANYCSRGVVVTHRELPVSKITLRTLALDIDSLWLNKLDKSLKEKEELGLINDEYYALCEQLLLVSHFTGLLRKFKCLREEYIDLLNSYKSQLQSREQIVFAERTAASLSVCSVDQEIKAVVSALTGLEKARQQEDKHAGRPVSCKTSAGAFDPESKNNAEATLAVLAEVYGVNFFRDVILNDLVSTASLGCIFSGGYFTSEKRDQQLMRLLEKGTDFTVVLADIANELRALTKPFLPGSQAKSM